jgi:hypothetical protein
MNYRIGLIGCALAMLFLGSCNDTRHDPNSHNPDSHEHGEVTTQGVLQSYTVSNVQYSFYANVLNDNQNCAANCGTNNQSSWRNVDSTDETAINNAWYTPSLYPMKAVLNLGASKTLEKLEFFIGNNQVGNLEIRVAATPAGLITSSPITFTLPANSYNTWQSKVITQTGQFIELSFLDASSRFNLSEVRVTVASTAGTGGDTPTSTPGAGTYGTLATCRPTQATPCGDFPSRAISSNAYQRLRDGLDHPDVSNRWYPSARGASGLTTNTSVLSACRALHDKFWVTGPDNKAYPTWHPPTYAVTVNNTAYTCLFGHEHGDNPWESVFYQQRGAGQSYNAQWNARMLPIPFGYANQVQQKTQADVSKHRHEDHVGHKMFWERFELAYGNGSGMGHIVPTSQVGSKITCDALLKIHFGTHSSDAFSNHLHEMVSNLHCKDAAGADTSRFHLTVLSPLAKPGFFSDECNGPSNGFGNTLNNTDSRKTAVPTLPVLVGNLFSTTLTANADKFNGERVIPDWDCVRSWAPATANNNDDIRKKIGQHMMEIWTTPTIITNAANATPLVQFTPYISVLNPARVHYRNLDGSISLRYSIEACKPGFANSPGGSGPNQLTEYCKKVVDNTITDWRDPRSPFNGTYRNVNFKGVWITNTTGSTAVYTDAFGKAITNTNNRETSIQQYVMTGNNGQFGASNSQVNNDNDNVGRGASYPTAGSNKVCSLLDNTRPVTCRWDGATTYIDKGDFSNTTVPVTLTTPLQYYRQQFALEWERDYQNSSYATPHKTFAEGVHAPN